MPTTRLRLSLAVAAIACATIIAPFDANAQARGKPARPARAPAAKRAAPVRVPAAAVHRKTPQINNNGTFRPGYGTAVAGGRYMPGTGVTGGYPGSAKVAGGTYRPGFGVTGSPSTAVSGGSYIPGLEDQGAIGLHAA